MSRSVSNNVGVPKLRFGSFKEFWTLNLFGSNILEHRGGAALRPQDFTKNPGWEVIPKKSISSGGLLQLDMEDPTYCHDKFFKSNLSNIVDSRYVITTLRDLVPSGPSIGYMVEFTAKTEYILAQGVYAFLLDETRVSKQFLIQLSNTPKYRRTMRIIMVGSTQVHIRTSDLFKTRFFFPSLPEQQKIASFLTAVDKKIQLLQKKKELLEQYKKGVMQKIFSREIRFRIKGPDGELVEPPDWEQRKLGGLGTFTGGGTPSRSTPDYWEGTIPWVSSSDIDDRDILNISISRFITEEAITESATKVVPSNSLLIVSRVGVGKVAVATKEICTSQDFTNFTPRHDNVYFLAHLIQFMASKLLSLNQGTSIKGFTKGDLAELILFMPCIKEQKRIADFASEIDCQLRGFDIAISNMIQFKKGLLQQMFV